MADAIMAPLASVEDLSVVNTPMATPISTPRSSPSRNRTRWSHRSSLDTILDENEDDIVIPSGGRLEEEYNISHRIEDDIVLRMKRENCRKMRESLARSERVETSILESSFETECSPLLDKIEPMSTQLNIDRLNQSELSKLNQSEHSKQKESDKSNETHIQSESSNKRFVNQSKVSGDSPLHHSDATYSQSELTYSPISQSEAVYSPISQSEVAYSPISQSEVAYSPINQSDDSTASYLGQSEAANKESTPKRLNKEDYLMIDITQT